MAGLLACVTCGTFPKQRFSGNSQMFSLTGMTHTVAGTAQAFAKALPDSLLMTRETSTKVRCEGRELRIKYQELRIKTQTICKL